MMLWEEIDNFVCVVVCCIMSVICDKKGNEKMYKLKMLSTSLEPKRKTAKSCWFKSAVAWETCCVTVAERLLLCDFNFVVLHEWFIHDCCLWNVSLIKPLGIIFNI